MSNNTFTELPEPPSHFSAQEIRIWYNIGTMLTENEKLTPNNLSLFSTLCFWEARKYSVQKNLKGEYTHNQHEITSGNTGHFSTSALLSNYKAIQDEINDLRCQLGLKPESTEYIANTPVFPNEVYQNLPEPIYRCCKRIDDRRKKDTFLIMAFPVIAFHTPNILFDCAEGRYGTEMLMVILNSNSAIYRSSKKAGDLSGALKNEVLHGRINNLTHIPTSLRSDSNKILHQLYQNNGRGLIFEDNMKTVVQKSRFDTDFFVDFIEHGLNNEPLKIITDQNKNSVIRPSLFGSLYGSLNDMKQIVEQAGAGHLTNYLFYLFEDKTDWESARPTETSTYLNNEVANFSELLLTLFHKLSDRKEPLFVNLTDKQWQTVDETFQKKMELLEEMENSPILQIANRKALLYSLKIVTVLSAIRTFDTEPNKLATLRAIQPSNKDLTAALWMSDTFLKHSVRLFMNLPVMLKQDNRGRRFNRYYNLLPVIFDTADALAIAKHLSIPKRTANRYLSDYHNNNNLIKLKRGVYQKI